MLPPALEFTNQILSSCFESECNDIDPVTRKSSHLPATAPLSSHAPDQRDQRDQQNDQDQQEQQDQPDDQEDQDLQDDHRDNGNSSSTLGTSAIASTASSQLSLIQQFALCAPSLALYWHL